MVAGQVIHHVLNNKNAQVLCLAPGIRQSSILFRKIREAFRHDFLKGNLIADSNTRIELNNNSEIIVLPGDNPKFIMGFSPTLLIIDEAAFVKEEIFAAILPSLMFTKGDLIYISTPAGKTGRFYYSFQDEEFEKYHIRCIDCPVNTQKELNNERKRRTEMEYLQMFEGEFVEQIDALFSRELIHSCIQDIPEEIKPRDHINYNYYLGVDVARYGLDETVYTIAEVDKRQRVRIIFIRNTSKKPTTDVIGKIIDLNNVFSFRQVFIDESGIGGPVTDILRERRINLGKVGTSKTSVEFTIKNKQEIYKNLSLLMEQGRLKFPNKERLIMQLSQLQYEHTESGLMKIHHPDETNAHDDFPDSLALACAGTIKKFTGAPIIIGSGKNPYP